MAKPNSSDEFKRDAVPDHRARVSGSGGVAAARGQPAFAVFVEAAAGEAGVRRCRQGCRDPAAEARVGPGDRGARHPKKATAYFARDAK